MRKSLRALCERGAHSHLSCLQYESKPTFPIFQKIHVVYVSVVRDVEMIFACEY
jgi:hypothetical protein